MPQKLNRAGKMQDYIPAGNGDPSGEYGTAKGTNKNFTTSDKKKSQANVITENKSVVVGKGRGNHKTGAERYNDRMNKIFDGFDKQNQKMAEFLLDKGVNEEEIKKLKDHTGLGRNALREKINEMGLDDEYFGNKETKANVIDNDITGKKEESFEDFYNSTYYTKDGNFYKKSGRDGSVKKISQKDYELAKNMNDDLNKLGKENSTRRMERIQKDTMEKVLNKKFIPFESVGSDIRDEFKKQVVNDFYKLHKDKNHTYTEEEVKKVVDSYNAWYSGSFTKQEIRNLTDALNTIVK